MSEALQSPYVYVEIVFKNGDEDFMCCPLQIGSNYATSEEITFQNGMLIPGWFALTDTAGMFRTHRLEEIRSISFKVERDND